MTTQEFNKLPKNQRKVLVAKDVLKNLKSKKYVAYEGRYIMGNWSWNNDEKDVKSNFKEISKCECCALGACLLSTTKYKNKLKFEDLPQYADSRNKSWKLLSTIFTPKEILLIECCFENGQSGSRVGKDIFGLHLNAEESELSKVYYGKFGTENDRLKAICKNIVRNKGIFKPKQDISK